MLEKNLTPHNEIKRFISNYAKMNGFPSVQWLIHKSGNVLSKGFVKSEEIANNLNSVEEPFYRIYSMTKPLIAFASLIAIEQNKLCLYDPVFKYIKSFKNVKVLRPNGMMEETNRPILIEDLLTHRSGMSYGFNRFCAIGQLYANQNLIKKASLNLKDFVEEIASYPLAFHPGSGWRYSLATDVLARILEIIFNDSIDLILFKEIFCQLEMLETSYSIPKNKMNRLMPICGEANLDKITEPKAFTNNFKFINLDKFYPSDGKTVRPRGGHGLFSTVSDYQKFANMLLTGKSNSGKRLVSKNMLKFALKNRISKNQRPMFVDVTPLDGYGWNFLGRIMKKPNKSLQLANKGEFGWAGAATTYFWIDPKLDLSGVVMSQVLGTTLPLGAEIKAKTYSVI